MVALPRVILLSLVGAASGAFVGGVGKAGEAGGRGEQTGGLLDLPVEAARDHVVAGYIEQIVAQGANEAGLEQVFARLRGEGAEAQELTVFSLVDEDRISALAVEDVVLGELERSLGRQDRGWSSGALGKMAMVLGSIGGPRAVGTLVRALEDGDVECRRQAADALMHFCSVEAAQGLARALQTDLQFGPARLGLARALVRCRDQVEDSELSSLIAGLLLDEDNKIKKFAWEELKTFQAWSPVVVQKMAEARQAASGPYRRTWAQALGVCRGKVQDSVLLPHIADLLLDKDDEIKAVAVKLLKKFQAWPPVVVQRLAAARRFAIGPHRQTWAQALIDGNRKIQASWQLLHVRGLLQAQDTWIRGVALGVLQLKAVWDSAGLGVLAAGHRHTCAIAKGAIRCWGSNKHGQTAVPFIWRWKFWKPPSWIAVAVGRRHTCGLLTDGTLRCWGWNKFGQTRVPADVGPWSAVALGEHHTCGLLADGTLRGWGENQYKYALTTVPAGPGPWRAVAVGRRHTCGVRADGTLRCWGENWTGQATVPAGLGPWRAVAVGFAHTCGLLAEGNLSCWGRNLDGQATVPAGLGPWRAVAVGQSHTCGLLAEGNLSCWGFNGFGQTRVPAGLGPWRAVALGTHHTCGLLADGTFRCWGAHDARDDHPAVPAGLSLF